NFLSLVINIPTGGSKGIGLATLELLLQQNINVLSISRSTPPELDALSSTYQGALVISKGDVSNDDDNKQAVEMCMQSFGRLDALILNAGTLHPLGTHRNLGGSTLSEYKQLFSINFFSLVSILSHSLPYLTSRESKSLSSSSDPAGRVILVSSGAAVGGVAGWGAYNASKAALNSLGRTLASEEEDLVVVSVRPGVVGTEMQEKIREIGKDHMTSKDLEKFMGIHERGELLLPSQPGRALASLALRATRDMSGEFLNWNDERVEAVLFEKKEGIADKK
ncbi:hypothetical protein JCM5353_002416, partial [Sporobolomyces roseus]